MRTLVYLAMSFQAQDWSVANIAIQQNIANKVIIIIIDPNSEVTLLARFHFLSL